MCELGINYNGPVGFIRLNEQSKNLREDFIENNPKKTIAELNDTSKVIHTFLFQISGMLFSCNIGVLFHA